MEMMIELNHILDGWLRWLRLRRAAVWMVRGLGIGLAASLGFALLALADQRILRDELLWIVAAGSVIGLAAGGLAAYLWPVRRLAAARFFDRRFHLMERVSTALELAETGSPLDGTHAHKDSADREFSPSSELRQQQLADALQAARRVNFRLLLPLRIPWQDLVVLALLIAGLVMVLGFGGPAFQAGLQARQEAQAIEEESAMLAELIEQVRSDPSLDPEEQAALTAPLEAARDRLEQADTVEQAVSALVSAEQEMERLADPQAGQAAESLRQAGQNLGAQEGTPLQSTGQELSRGDLEAAAREMSRSDPGQMSPAERQEFARQLEELAESVSDVDAGLAEQLRSAAEAARAGNDAAARENLQEAARTLQGLDERAARSERAGEVAGQLRAGQERAMQASGSGRGQASVPGEGTAETGQGSGEAGPSGDQGQAGSGSGRGEAGEPGQDGAPVGSEPIETGNGPGDGGLQPYESIYAPQRLGGQEGEDVVLPGSQQPGDPTGGQGASSPGAPGQSRVPYVDVFPSYAEAYRQAVESGEIPVQFRDLIRDYFSSLEP